MALKKSQLYSSLWQSCDELRGGMDASQYKDYVLTLLFMKYVSDKYAGKPNALIEQRRREALDYKAYLERIVELTKRVSRPETQDYPTAINSPARRALYDNLKGVSGLADLVTPAHVAADSRADAAEIAALAVDDAIRAVKKADWRGNRFKEREVRNAIKEVLKDDALVDRVLEIVKAQREY